MMHLPTLMIGGLALAALGLGLVPPKVASPGPKTMRTVDGFTTFTPALAHPPQRVVMYGFEQTSYVAVDGTAEHLASVTGRLKQEMQGSSFIRAFPGIDRLPVSSPWVWPEPERHMLLNADAVIAWGNGNGSGGGALEPLGIPNLIEMSIKARGKEYRLAQRQILPFLGEVTGKRARADELLRHGEQFTAQVLSYLARPGLKPARVLIAVGYTQGNWYLGAKGFTLNDFVQSVGGINLKGDKPWQANDSLENVIIYDPDIILLMMHHNGNGQDSEPVAFYADPALQSLRAVRNRRIYRVPWYFQGNAAVDEPLVTVWLAELFHPEAMPRMTRAAYRDFFARAYDYRISDDEIDQELFLDTNGVSAGYGRFTRFAVHDRM